MSLSNGLCRSGIHGGRPQRQISASPSNWSLPDRSARLALSIDVRSREQRLVFTADDAVLHAARELIADLAGLMMVCVASGTRFAAP